MKTNAFSILSFTMICCIALLIGGCSEDSVEQHDSKQISTVNSMKHPLRERDDTLLMPLTPNTAWFFDISYQDVNTGKFLEPNADYPFPLGDMEIGKFIEESDLNPAVIEDIFANSTLEWLGLDKKMFL